MFLQSQYPHLCLPSGRNIAIGQIQDGFPHRVSTCVWRPLEVCEWMSPIVQFWGHPSCSLRALQPCCREGKLGSFFFLLGGHSDCGLLYGNGCSLSLGLLASSSHCHVALAWSLSLLVYVFSYSSHGTVIHFREETDIRQTPVDQEIEKLKMSTGKLWLRVLYVM